MEKKTDLFLIGSPKCGTTSLHMYLGQHPEIYPCPVKESNFFFAQKEKSYYCTPASQRKFSFPVGDDAGAYETLFRKALSTQRRLDSSVLYLFARQAHARLKAYNPSARFIAILRHPVQRAYAQYLFRKARGLEPTQDFGRAIREDLEGRRDDWWPMSRYVALGLYHEQLEHFLRFFPREQLKIYLYEDFGADPAGVIRDVFGFAGVDDGFVPDRSLRYNVGGYREEGFSRSKIPGYNRIRNALFNLVPKRFSDTIFFHPWMIRLMDRPKTS